MTHNLDNYTIYTADSGESHMRLDEFIFKRQGLMPMGAIRVAIALGNVLVNDRHRSAGWKLRTNDTIRVKLDDYQHFELEAENIPLNILYEDEVVIAVNKPPRMLSHPTRYERKGTLLNALLYHFISQGKKAPRLGLVHRLDRDTSGILLISKQETILHKLAAQFDQRKVKKTYSAIVFGVPDKMEGKINASIGWHPTISKWGVDGENSKTAFSEYIVKMTTGNFSYLELHLHTGRTHQLRIHTAHLGHPIVGDLVYGSNETLGLQESNPEYKDIRQLLHASNLTFSHPTTNKAINLFAPMPKDMEDFLIFAKSCL
jgi:23S rRNA pseudouridine1911/1915/1917 synthase